MASDKKVLKAIENYLEAEAEQSKRQLEGPKPLTTPAPAPGEAPRSLPEIRKDMVDQATTWKAGRGIKKIVVAADHECHPAIDAALSLGKPFGAEVVIVFVLNPMIGVVSEAGYVDSQTIEVQREHAREVLKNITEQLPTNALAFTYLLEGDPSEEIVQTAKDFDADMIVMGTHRRGALKRFFLGSVSQAVVRKAHCPVLLVSDLAPASKESVAARATH
jgi:nucleotide-binding universal stress UspA family protein